MSAVGLDSALEAEKWIGIWEILSKVFLVTGTHTVQIIEESLALQSVGIKFFLIISSMPIIEPGIDRRCKVKIY